MTVNFRTWARGKVVSSTRVGFVTSEAPVLGFDSAVTAWPNSIIHYLIQYGPRWEVGVGLLRDPIPGVEDVEKILVRYAAVASSAGAGLLESLSPGDPVNVAFSHSTLTPYPRWWELYGDGSDGDVTLSGAVALTRSMFYRNLTLAADAVVTTSGCAIHVRDRLTLPDSRSTAAPVFLGHAGVGGDQTQAYTYAGGYPAEYLGSPPGTIAGPGYPGGGAFTFRMGGEGGAGGPGGDVPPGWDTTNYGGAGGSGGSGPVLPAWVGTPEVDVVIGGCAGGSGGGGGANTAGGYSQGGEGGSGGYGGAIVRIHARIIDGGTWAGAPLLLATAHGGDGSPGSPGIGQGGDGGGGGGGGGGALVIVSDFINRLPWTFEANGGAPGGGGAYGGAGGAVYAWVGGA